MKKFSFLSFVLFLVFSLSACGSNDASEDKTNGSTTNVENEQVETDTTESETTAIVGPIESTKEHVCAFCNMEVYTKDEDLGVFTAQAIDSKGNHLFFDDSGCLLNYERKTGEALSEKWVRDYVTKEWITDIDAVPVHSEIKTPMKYGYSFFASQEDADKFVSEKTNANAVLSSWEEIDQVSHERFMKKMKMTEGSEDSDHDQGDEHGEESEDSGSH